MPPPQSFLDDLADAAKNRHPARIALLALESESYSWHAEAQRLAADAIQTLGQGEPAYAHAILFTGHMIDAPNRPQPRFPASAEPAARAAILSSLQSLLNSHPGPTIGVAGGASGGDLLFHESCAELGIETLLRLTLPEPEFLAASVVPAGGDWVVRFHALTRRLGPGRIEVLGETKSLPNWMGDRKDYDVWQRTNLWLVEEAILLASERTLLALWDGKTGDGPGGTQHLVEAAPRYAISVAPPILTGSLW